MLAWESALNVSSKHSGATLASEIRCVARTVIDASQTIAEFIRQHDETRSVFLRHGLADEQSSSKSLADVCAEHGLDVAMLERELIDAIEESRPFEHGGFEWNAITGVVHVSPSLTAMLELVERTGPASAFLARVHPEDRERVRALFRAARE